MLFVVFAVCGRYLGVVAVMQFVALFWRLIGFGVGGWLLLLIVLLFLILWIFVDVPCSRSCYLVNLVLVCVFDFCLGMCLLWLG